MPSAFGERREGWVDALLVLLLGALIALTVAVVLLPQVRPALVHERLDLAINVGALLVAAAVTGLAWGRYREGLEWASLYRSSAFLVLAAINALIVFWILSGLDSRLGAGLEDPRPLPLLIALFGRGLAALMLMIGGVLAVRGAVGRTGWAWAVLLVPTLAVIGLIAAGQLAEDYLLWLVDPAVGHSISQNPTEQLSAPISLGVLISSGLIAAGFLAAGGLAYVAYRTRGLERDAILAAGLLLAAFSAIHGAIHPGVYTGLVTTGDLLRTAFYGVILLSLFAESREDVRALKSAHVELQRLHDADVARATQEERARLAREIHDGLAQHLWYAKLKQDRLASIELDREERRTLAGEVADALDSALAETRQAVMALRPAEEGSLDVVLRRYVEDFGDRFGIPVECTIDLLDSRLPTRTQAELLRIVQEALNNVRKHADATLVRVRGRTDAGTLRITVADNGRGFHPGDPSSGYGLTSMQERAAIIGARLWVESQPQDGTRVELELGL